MGRKPGVNEKRVANREMVPAFGFGCWSMVRLKRISVMPIGVGAGQVGSDNERFIGV
ncbi:MAG: hypothetical protein JWQ21_1272 [Herminiimonas sp.]|nr:hypothetical protein [Herminiimonas sp.]